MNVSVAPSVRDLPMTPERHATGRVAAVYLDIRRHVPFVPSFFKSLAINPSYLELAWLQIREAGPRLDELAAQLVDEAEKRGDDLGLPRLSSTCREVLVPFRPVVPRMVLIAEYLGRLLAGELAARPPATQVPLPSAKTVPDPAVPVREPRASTDETTRRIYVEIQATYGVPLVASLFRSLAASGQLEEAWAVGGPFQAAPEGYAHAGWISSRAIALLAGDPDLRSGFATRDALAERGDADAAPAILELLELYRIALPQALAFMTLARDEST